jgi:hypothetical protein
MSYWSAPGVAGYLYLYHLCRWPRSVPSKLQPLRRSRVTTSAHSPTYSDRHEPSFRGWVYFRTINHDLMSRNAQKQQEQTDTIPTTSPLFFNWLITIGHALYPVSFGFRTRRIGFNTFLKAGRHVDISEAGTMRYIANNTTIPVPKVQRVWRHDGVTYITTWTLSMGKS